VERIYLFGSYAYGTPHKDSDFDFYVVLPDDCPMKQGDAIDHIRKEIRPVKNGMPVDLLVNYKSRFDELSQLPTMLRQIVDEGIVLYDINRLAPAPKVRA
jgi:hypothetical protein